MTETDQFEDFPLRRTRRNPQYTAGLEPAAVQIMDRATLYPLDRRDLQRLLETVNHPKNLRGSGGSKMTPEQIIQWSQNWWGDEVTPEHYPEEQFLWAIRGRVHQSPESGELIGYVTAYTPGPALLKRLDSSGLLDLAKVSSHLSQTPGSKPAIYEISYSKNLALSDPDNQLKGTVSSAVRQVTLSIGNMQQEVDIAKEGNDPNAVFPNALVFAFIKPNNPESARVAGKSGYTKIGTIKYHGNDKTESEVWVVDWAKVSQALKANHVAS